ncbi:MAG: ABC-F family ATP-binding cassette domain-containing protein [Opitutales bacterium]|nr:ABC-F family ATP-binding cassette domain-containing protein [Opitutales bacterium]
MIELRNISLAFGQRKLFDNISCVINRGEKIGLVGSNGAGKTTLLKILANIEDNFSGSVLRPKYATVGYLPQDISTLSENTLFDEAKSAFENIVELQNRLKDAENILKTSPETSAEYLAALEEIGELEHKLEDLDAYRLRSKIETVLHGLGFAPSDAEKKCSEFSGGWKMRIALAKLLLKEPSLPMLDEPTNHLDIESITWLEDYLKACKSAVVIVSHDRSFLDLLTKKTFFLSAGRLEIYAGNYSFYEKESSARRQILEKMAANQAREIEKTERFIERFRAKNTKAAQVQSRIKALEKIERIELESLESGIAFKFPEPRRCGQVVINVENLCKSYGEKEVLKNVNLKIERGERIAIVGANGAGKTTLAKIMAGELGFDSGKVELGYNVDLSYFTQHQAAELNPENTVLEEAESSAPRGEKFKARGLLGSFLFSGDDVFKKVAVLSGGEKNRLALAKMLLRSFNFLILDEPTNHLDINSKKVLQRALADYGGTFAIVSHDRDFLDGIATKVVEIGKRGVRSFPGNISDYIEKIRAEGAFDAPDAPKKPNEKALSYKEKKAIKSAQNREMGRIKRRIEEIENEILSNDGECENLEAQMADPEFFKDAQNSRQVVEKHSLLKKKTESLYDEWQQLAQSLSELQNK